ncbi:glycosyltransferase family 4 protein [Sagittula salina]|uniref:Glycosyltransferase family 4 protein n=1 Tax=Sagittula salina TaxID=2820268 RepID=A0A940S4T8_9RHOB|nr:glycosyltransferase family 4 protein [Sagittula salina]MBP0484459.1 glycosyltransferase family 4 protein [Sagittula salina]
MRLLLTGNTSFKIANFRSGLIRALQQEGHRLSVLAPRDAHTPALEAMGCSFLPLKMDRNGTDPKAEWALLRAVDRALGAELPDAVFSYTIKNNIYTGLACRRRGIPFAPNVTGLGPAFNDEGMLNRVIRGLYRGAFARAPRVFFQNSDDRALFVSAGLVPEARTRLLPGSGVDLERFPAAPLPPEDAGLRCLLVARMLRDKGVALFAEAARMLRDSHPQLRFALLGPIDADSRSGVPRTEIDAWVAEGLVDYLGSTDDVRPYLRRAHCVVLPSYYREGTPRSLLEAAAAARPLITTDMPGCRDLVREGRNGFLVPPRDARGLAAALARFAEAPRAAREAMGRASRALVEAEYDERIVIDAYRDLLAEVGSFAPAARTG